ncbi:MAG: galactose ABC transporter substrate-binding protein [Bacillota bacterium]
MKKKLIAILIVLALSIASVITVTACNPESTFTADVFIYDYSDTYISTVRSSLEDEFKKKGISYNFYDAANNQSTQTDQIDTALSKGSDLLIVNIVDTSSEDTAKSIVEKAEEKGVPVVFFNREPSSTIFTTDYAESTAFVGTNYVQAGYMQGEMIANDLMANETDDGFAIADVNKDNEIQYIMMRGEMSNNEAIARTLYSVITANKILADNDKEYKLVASTLNATTGDSASAPDGWSFSYDDEDLTLAAAITKYCDGVSPLSAYSVDDGGAWSSTKAQAMMDTILGSDASKITSGQVEMAICNNDGMAEGVISSLYDIGYNTTTYDSAKYLPVYGVDATDAAKSLIKEKRMSGSIAQDGAAMAEAIASLALNVQEGETLMSNTDDYIVDGEKENNIRIPYAIYTGE